jgi:hypothetical protein
VVPTVELVKAKPPPELLLPCPREPPVYPRGAGQQEQALWVSGVLVAGERCRLNSDKLQDFFR